MLAALRASSPSRAQSVRRPSAPPEVAIVVVTHNAARHCLALFRSLRRTREAAYEVVVVDNASSWRLRALLLVLARVGAIDRLCLLRENTLFAEGNNIGVAAASRAAPRVLLLNSDVVIRDPLWLRKLLDFHEGGISALGPQYEPPFPRADGWCMLVDRDLYLRHGLDEAYPWWWCVSKLQADALRDGHPVRCVERFEDLVSHAYHGSGEAFAGARGMDLDPAAVEAWFEGRRPLLVESVDGR